MEQSWIAGGTREHNKASMSTPYKSNQRLLFNKEATLLGYFIRVIV